MKTRLKELRRALHVSQREFGERIGVKVATVGSWEIGSPVPVSRIIQICSAFGVNREWLETGVGEMFTPQPTEKDVLKDAILVLFQSLSKDAQTVVLETLTEYNRKKEFEKSAENSGANSPQISGDKNVVNFGAIDINIEK